jgi:tetratricopeptide (TPR) repeat protein
MSQRPFCRTRSAAATFVVLSLGFTSPCHGAEPSPISKAAREEAAQRFDRGLKLFDAQDNAGALAEFLRADEIAPHVLLAYNIGLVYAAMNRPVDATQALERALKTADGLKPAQQARARAVHAEQSARVARVRVTTKPEGARLEVDGVTAGKTPLSEPLRVSSGTHVIGAVLEEHAPSRKEITIAGNQELALELELLPTEGSRLAHLGMKTNVADASISVDGQRVAKTPLAASLALTAGRHRVEVSRPGYSSVAQEIELGPGATGELVFDLTVDAAAVNQSGALLTLALSEPGAVVSVDGKTLGPYRGALKLPHGVHTLRVERDGFFPAERQIVLEPLAENRQVIHLQPTSETLAEHESKVSFHRTWGWVGVIGGAAAAGAGAAYLAVNAGAKSDAKDALGTVYDQEKNEVICDVASGDDWEDCNARYFLAKKNYDDKKKRDVFGFVGIGVGGALIATGVVLLLTGPASDKYDEVATLDLQVSPSSAFATVTGAF